MTFDRELLALYRQLLQTTRLADAYAEFVRMFRFLRVRLEQEMPAYTFQGGIVENAMDYSYFQCASPALKGLGLKLAVVFVHRPFRLEVWLWGRNRACQQQWHKRLQTGGTPFELAQDPARQDYILRARRCPTSIWPTQTGWCRFCGRRWKQWPAPSNKETGSRKPG